MNRRIFTSRRWYNTEAIIAWGVNFALWALIGALLAWGF